jgi:hypothetical protein
MSKEILPGWLSASLQGVLVRKLSENERGDKEFKEWEKHYLKSVGAKNPDIDIYGFEFLYLVFNGSDKVGLLYLRPKNKTLYFVFYTLDEFTKKGLGLGEKVIQIVSRIARGGGYEKIGVLTSRVCSVYPYYEKRGFKIILENPFGYIWMEKEVGLKEAKLTG